MPHFLQLGLLAQDTTAVSGQLYYAIDQLLTPAGITLTVLGIIAVAVIFRLGKAIPVLSGLVLFAVSFQLHPDALTLNILVGPLQTFRYLSKSIAFGALGLAILALFALPKGSRTRYAGFAASAFFAFQVCYDLQYTLFVTDGGLKGMFGLASMSFMFLVYAWAFGHRLTDPEGAFDALSVLGWVGLGFVAVNLVQIVAGLSGALVAGRLAGIAGNAQMMGAITTMLLLANTYLFMSSPGRSAIRWVSLACVGILPVFILWTGSRTAVMASSLGLLLMFRLQVGRLAILAVAAGLVFLAASTVLESEDLVTSRFASGVNTREVGWTNALSVFAQSPIFGEFPFLPRGAEPNGIESTWLRSLANMGILGGVIIVIPFVSMIASGVSALRLGRQDPSYRRLCDLYLGSIGAILVLNTFDGYAFGYLTFPVLFMYMLFTLGGFISDKYAESVEAPDSPYEAGLAGS